MCLGSGRSPGTCLPLVSPTTYHVSPPDAGTLSDRVLAGDPRAVARAISLVEDRSVDGRELMRRIYSHAGHAYLVGVTGPPGAGKSTLVNGLIAELRKTDRTVGVIAVDPSSPFTGGAILGDRLRMGAHARDPGVFIRSMATRGRLGGLARATSDAAVVLDAAGTDVVVIETVGVGQDEVDVVRTADVSVVTLVPGAGDDVQAIKAGIMEIADIFVVNKADREGADRLAEAITASLSLQEFAAGEWRPPVLKTDSSRGVGIGELWSAIEEFRAQAGARHGDRRKVRDLWRLRDLVAERFAWQVDRAIGPEEFERLVAELAAGRLDPHTAADEVVTRTCRAVASAVAGTGPI